MIESTRFCPLVSTKKRREKVNSDYESLLMEANRNYELATKPLTDFPSTQGEGGWFNNRPANLYALMAWWLKEDRLALSSACNIAEWLMGSWETRDNAHNQRCNWIVPTGLAYYEASGDKTKFDGYLMFWLHSVLPFVANAKYLQTMVGSTLRPFIRTVGRAIEAAYFLDLLIDEELIDPDYEHTSESMREAAYHQIDQWNHALVGHPRGGFLFPLTTQYVPYWRNFVYQDALDPATSAKNLTYFMVGHIAPYEALVMDLYGNTSSEFKTRMRDIASHAYLFGYDPESARTLRAVGFKTGGDHTACYAPGFCDKPLSELTPEQVEKYAEEGYHDFSQCLMAAEIGKEERRAQLVNWTAQAKAVTPGEIPLGLAYAAVKLGIGENGL